MSKEPPKWPGRISAFFAQRRWAQILLFLVLSLPPLLVLTIGPVALMIRLNAEVKASEAYVQSLEATRASQAVRDAVGEPLEAAYWTDAQMLADDDEKKIAYPAVRYDVSGPKGTATIEYRAEQVDGVWKLKRAEATLDPREPPVQIWPAKKRDETDANDEVEQTDEKVGDPGSEETDVPSDQAAK